MTNPTGSIPLKNQLSHLSLPQSPHIFLPWATSFSTQSDWPDAVVARSSVQWRSPSPVSFRAAREAVCSNNPFSAVLVHLANLSVSQAQVFSSVPVIGNPLYGNRCELREGHQCRGVSDTEVWAISLSVSSGPSQAQSYMYHFDSCWVCWPLWVWRNPAHDRQFGMCSIAIYSMFRGSSSTTAQ